MNKAIHFQFLILCSPLFIPGVIQKFAEEKEETIDQAEVDIEEGGGKNPKTIYYQAHSITPRQTSSCFHQPQEWG